MKLRRRQFLRLAAGATVFSIVPRSVRAASYPSRPVRLVVGYSAGSSADILARLIGQWLSERLGQPFIVENRPGAGTNIATELVVRSEPDGYTLLLATPANAVNATLYEKLNFNFIRDIAPVASFVRAPLVLEVHPSVPVETVSDFITYAKAHPGKLSMASGGNGAMAHMSGELFKMMAGVNMVHVPYRGGGSALVDLLAGQVQVMFDVTASSIEHIRSGKLRALAVTTATRSDVLPNIPTLAEFVPGYEASTWVLICMPNPAPAEIIDKLNGEITAGLDNHKFKSRLSDLGAAGFKSLPADLGKFIADETEKWAKVVKLTGLKAN